MRYCAVFPSSASWKAKKERMENRIDVPFTWLRGGATCLGNLTLRVRYLRFAPRVFFLLVCLCLVLPPMPGVAAPAHKAVLLVLPFQSDLPRGELARQAMLAEFGNASDLTIDWYYEYLDLNRFSGEDYEQQVADLYAAKYSQTSLDLVFVLSELALNFWLQHRDEIQPNAPVVFFNASDPKYLTESQLPANVTGLVSTTDRTQLLKWVSRTRPSVTQIVLVQGAGKAEQNVNFSLEALQNDLDGRVQLVDWSHLPLAEIKQRAASLPANSMIFYQFMFQDAAGVTYRPIDVLSGLTSVSSVPVITTQDYFIGLGTIGGYVFSIEYVAEGAARLGERILRGESASGIPVAEYQSNRFIFDHLALQRYGIPLSALPEGSIIRNRQYSLWEQYWPQLMGLGAGVVGLMLLVVYLGIVTHRLGTARRALSQLNTDLEIQVQERTTSLSQTNRLLEAEIVEREQTEAIMRLRLKLFEFAATHSLEELMQRALDEIGRITDSPIGFYHFVEADQRMLSLQAWSTRTLQEFCVAEGKGMHYSLDEAGVWADCARQRQPVIHNDYAALPASRRRGLPAGHAEVRRELVVPTMRGAQIVAILGVGNKPVEYDERDVELVAYVADVIWSIVERKRAEETLRHYADQLTAQNAELDAFAHTVAHDLKNPLGIITGFANVLDTDCETMSPEEISEASRYIARSGEKLDTIIEELLLLAGVRKQDVIPQPLDMGRIVREAIERLQLLIQDQQAQITLQDEAGWPVALGHASWIEEVWANYLSNALKYGGRPPRIIVGATRQLDRQARFWVKDNGLGLSKEAQTELFTPFTRLEQVNLQGHGLGLSVVQRIVDRLGGQVGVESEPGHGSTFFFTLPARQ